MVSMSLHDHLLLQSVSDSACVLPVMRLGGWRCGGPGRATGDTARVYTSAGDCIEGVSSAGGVKSISSSKWSSNSCIQLRQNNLAHHQSSRCHLAWVLCTVSHLKVDLPLFAAGHTVHEQHHKGHKSCQRHHQGHAEGQGLCVPCAST